MGKSIALCVALLCLSQAAEAQDHKIHGAAAAISRGTPRSHETLDASVARFAVKATFQPTAAPTQQELLGVILLMSLRQQKGSRI